MEPEGQRNERCELHTTLPGIGTDVLNNVSRGVRSSREIYWGTSRHDSGKSGNKRKLDNDNQAQRQPTKRQNVARAYSARSSEKKEYAGTLP
ncbi:hypothetical protein Tco_1144229, partial [Tanacetum coccineum]